jgi:predicted phage-related endonuclease
MFPAAVPIVGWPDTLTGTSDADWLTARRAGLGASEVASALGLPGAYETPWQVWAEKTGRAVPVFAGNDATDLGNGLEPWLIGQAAGVVGARWVERTLFRLYRSAARPWMLASPDAAGCDLTPATVLVECKTAGLVEPHAVRDWTATDVQMAVLGVQTRVHVVGLVAGHGLRSWPVEWDPVAEAQLVRAAGEWWDTHVVGDVEPAMFPADDATMNAIYPPVEGAVGLPAVAEFVLEEYREAVADGAAAGRRRKELAATLKRWLAGATVGELDGRQVVTWYENSAGVRSLRVKGT